MPSKRLHYSRGSTAPWSSADQVPAALHEQPGDQRTRSGQGVEVDILYLEKSLSGRHNNARNHVPAR